MTRYMYLKSYKPCKVSLVCEPGSKFMLHVRGREEFFDSSDERMMIYYIYGVGDFEKFSEYLCMCAKLIPLNEKDLEAIITEFKSQREVVPIVKYPIERIPLIADPIEGLTIKGRLGIFSFTAEQEKALVRAIQEDPTREAAGGYCRIVKKLNKREKFNSPKCLSVLSYKDFLHIHGILSLPKRKLTIKEKIRYGFSLFMAMYGQIIFGVVIVVWALDNDWENPVWLTLLLFILGCYLTADPLLLYFDKGYAEKAQEQRRIPLFMDLFWPDRYKVD